MNTIDEAIILAGGLGTRLREVIKDIPKPLAPIAGQPFLNIHLNHLQKQGIKQVILSIGYKAEQIQDQFGSSYHGMAITYVVEKQKLGTGGAIRLAMSHANSKAVCVLNGDSFLPFDLSAGVALFDQDQKPIIYGCQVTDTARFGRIEHENGIIKGFREKGLTGPGVINAGIYLLPTNLLDDFPINQPFSLEQAFFSQVGLDQGFRLLVVNEPFIDIGIPEDYQRAQTELLAYVS